MSEYTYAKPGPGFPKIRWHERADGRFLAEWVVELVKPGPSLIPLALRVAPGDVDIEVLSGSGNSLVVRLVSETRSIQPEVYSVFYQLIRPAFEQGFVREIEGGSLEVHRYIIEGTERLPAAGSSGEPSARPMLRADRPPRSRTSRRRPKKE